jgi:hypothetical protein
VPNECGEALPGADSAMTDAQTRKRLGFGLGAALQRDMSGQLIEVRNNTKLELMVTLAAPGSG